ncbi:uncharacterized protein LOC130451382 [Diorhabda sublineata]|uniref:uncharacterized protein LOC130451382 n=1 Tax=Diorhabda sublineata TaxID=1163346 RepID=UPI0024E168AE|nr:uncharacterized protein LOC130451382 [Diorhabda sublineata]
MEGVDKVKSVKLKNLKVVIFRSKFFPQQYAPKKKKVLNKIIGREKKRLNIRNNLMNSEDKEKIVENVRHTSKKRSTFQEQVPFIILERHKLNNMFSKLKQKEKQGNKQKQLLTCLKSIQYPKSNIWSIPINIINAIKDSLLTRNWSNITYLLLQLINCPDNKYRPIIKKVYQIMDKLNPLLVENDLQGEYKKILAARIQILDSTTVV